MGKIFRLCVYLQFRHIFYLHLWECVLTRTNIILKYFYPGASTIFLIVYFRWRLSGSHLMAVFFKIKAFFNRNCINTTDWSNSLARDWTAGYSGNIPVSTNSRLDLQSVDFLSHHVFGLQYDTHYTVHLVCFQNQKNPREL